MDGEQRIQNKERWEKKKEDTSQVASQPEGREGNRRKSSTMHANRPEREREQEKKEKHPVREAAILL